jgi:hypothetical protein
MVALAGRGWSLAPSLRAMFDEADRRWPKRSRVSDGSIGDRAHAARTSDHNPDASGDVLAGDLTDDKDNGCDADLFAEHLRKSRDPRVKYVICNGKVFRSYGSSAWQWTPYTGANGHFAHTHVSILDTAEAKNDTSPWFDYADAPDPIAKPPASTFLEDTVALAAHPTTAGRVDECVVGADGAVYHRGGSDKAPDYYTQGWEFLEGNRGGPVRSVACAWNPEGTAFIVRIHAANNLSYQRVYDGTNGWGPWLPLDGALIA